MTKRDGNTDALRAHKADSVKETRQELELAIRRIVNGNPQHVKKGTPLSPAAVAAEAGVDRSTLYRYHEPVLTEIRRTTDATPQKKLHLFSQRLVRKLEGHKNKGKQVVIDHLIPYPATIEADAGAIRVRLLDFDDLTGLGTCRTSAIRVAQDVLLRRILNLMRESRPIPSPDQYLELVDERSVVMVDPLAGEVV